MDQGAFELSTVNDTHDVTYKKSEGRLDPERLMEGGKRQGRGHEA